MSFGILTRFHHFWNTSKNSSIQGRHNPLEPSHLPPAGGSNHCFLVSWSISLVHLVVFKVVLSLFRGSASPIEWQFAIGFSQSNEAGCAATSSGQSVGGEELGSQPAGMHEIETMIGG